MNESQIYAPALTKEKWLLLCSRAHVLFVVQLRNIQQDGALDFDCTHALDLHIKCMSIAAKAAGGDQQALDACSSAHQLYEQYNREQHPAKH